MSASGRSRFSGTGSESVPGFRFPVSGTGYGIGIGYWLSDRTMELCNTMRRDRHETLGHLTKAILRCLAHLDYLLAHRSRAGMAPARVIASKRRHLPPAPERSPRSSLAERGLESSPLDEDSREQNYRESCAGFQPPLGYFS